MNKKIEISNDINSFVVEEMRRRLAQGIDVTMAFGGHSMLPLIDGDGDTVVLRQVGINETLRKGDIYLFFYQNRCVVHRYLRTMDGMMVFRGDNCYGKERVERSAVIARVVEVVKNDGHRCSCDGFSWRFRSQCIVLWRTLYNAAVSCFGRRHRRWERWVYFICLLLLMWAPVGVLGVPLNNFVFGIRLDHLLHASVYVPCVLFLMDFRLFQPLVRTWVAAVAVGITTEAVQYLLPYRGFDINDLVANFLGVTLGFVIICLLKRRTTQAKKNK